MAPPRHRVRVYDQLRTAHLERAHELAPATLAYFARSYDFDEQRAAGIDLVHLAGAEDLVRLLLRSDVREVEVNEPLMLQGLKHTLVAVASARLAGLLRRRRVRVATYAIENGDPLLSSSRRLRSPWRRRAYRWAAGAAMRQVDRVAYGTAGAQECYRELRAGRRTEHVLVPALSARCACVTDSAHRAPVVLFLGAFDDRKGVLALLDVWPGVAARVAGARLVLAGKGPHEDVVRGWARDRIDVELVVDPPRDEVHAMLRRARVLVLWSQPSPTWREQVGLPLVEGLAHGCEVVASDETGIADWLAAHRHHVAAVADGTPGLERAVVGALTSGRTPAEVLGDLPDVDGRLAADHWLWS